MGKTWKGWSPEENELLKKRYANEKNEVLAAELNRETNAVRIQGNRLGLKKSKEFIENNHPGRFLFGSKNGRWNPIGDARLLSGLVQVKIRDTGSPNTDYVFLHHLVWELHHGPIPSQHNVKFRDGNKENFSPENLMLVSWGDHIQENSGKNLPPELQEVMQLKKEITRQINRQKK